MVIDVLVCKNIVWLMCVCSVCIFVAMCLKNDLAFTKLHTCISYATVGACYAKTRFSHRTEILTLKPTQTMFMSLATKRDKKVESVMVKM